MSSVFDSVKGSHAAHLAERILDLADLLHDASNSGESELGFGKTTIDAWGRITGCSRDSAIRSFYRTKAMLEGQGVQFDKIANVLTFDRKSLELFVGDELARATEILEAFKTKHRFRGRATNFINGGSVKQDKEDDETDGIEALDEEDQEAEDEAEDEAEADEKAAEAEEERSEPEAFPCDECDYVGMSARGLHSHKISHGRARKAERREQARVKREAAAASRDPLTALREALAALPEAARRPALELLLALEAS